MKIISKYKDYYDYLSGIYGVDPLIVLDRTKFDHIEFFRSEVRLLNVYICGMHYQGIYHKGEFLWGEDLKKLQASDEEWMANRGTKLSSWLHVPKENELYVKLDSRQEYSGTLTYRKVSLIPVIDKEQVNVKENCPIVVNANGYSNSKFPILKDIRLNQILPPQDIYLMLSEWLAPKENITNTQTDKDKILSHGFDTKTSFRGKR